MYLYIYIFRLIAWDLLRLSKVLFHCPVLILFGVIHEALGVTMQLPAAIFSAACKFWELGISFAHFCGMSTRWERRSQKVAGEIGSIKSEQFRSKFGKCGCVDRPQPEVCLMEGTVLRWIHG